MLTSYFWSVWAHKIELLIIEDMSNYAMTTISQPCSADCRQEILHFNWKHYILCILNCSFLYYKYMKILLLF
jgi:hypothetical protein